jgi:voltage-gated potassium channel
MAGFMTRSFDRFLDRPDSPARAAWTIMAATALATVAGAIVIVFLDRRDFESFGSALWFSLQTVTTVGYGDYVPGSAVGRSIAAVVMLVGIAFSAVVTAAITSTFVEAARRGRSAADEEGEATRHGVLLSNLEELNARLERIEAALGLQAGAPEGGEPRGTSTKT